MTRLTGLLHPQPLVEGNGGNLVLPVLAVPGLVWCARAPFEQLSVVSMKLPGSPACADASQTPFHAAKGLQC